ncbi:MAG TPA: hypothetical protein DEP48_05985 [Persephonella sp.]|uniref:Uncharacterized protein n=1 Tax=Persephonella marina (strain DSM 14350 / EX-H1) TaxID=123214 RepID=C0QP97_PERMH|nr:MULTISPECIES: hypothetical protein [Persephonella]ACO03124.1 hypothetical protein PERMA_0704 [Persephonella marina EX-H1]HCB69892.1 hypothetical protein [Persephonella sp.]
MKKIDDLQVFVKDVVSKEYPSFKDGCVMVYQLGKDHLLLELFDKNENKAGEIILNLKSEKLYKDGRGYRVKIEGTPKGMIRYYLQEGNRKLEGKAEGLHPCLTF